MEVGKQESVIQSPSQENFRNFAERTKVLFSLQKEMKIFKVNCGKCKHVRIQIISEELSHLMSYDDNARIFVSYMEMCKVWQL